MTLDNAMLVQTLAVCVGLMCGAMWRAGSLFNEGKPWRAVWVDLFVSAMIGGANAVLTVALADLTGVGPLLTMALASWSARPVCARFPEMKAVVVDLIKRRLTGGDN